GGEGEHADEIPGLRHGSLSSFRGSRATYGRPRGGLATGLWRPGDEVVTDPESPAGNGCTVSAMAIDDALDRVEAQLQEEGQRVVSAVRGATRALQDRDVELADEVIAFDDVIDRQFLGVEGAIQSILALQGPVARDLRLLLAMLHINLL